MKHLEQKKGIGSKYTTPRLCACTVDTFSSYLAHVKTSIEKVIKDQYASYYEYLECIESIDTLNMILDKASMKCGLVNEYRNNYAPLLRKCAKMLYEEPTSYSGSEVISLLDELMIMVWKDLCAEEKYIQLPTSGEELSEEELEKYALTEEEQKKLEEPYTEEKYVPRILQEEKHL